MSIFVRSAVVLASIVVVAACTTSPEEQEPAGESAEQSLTACPAIAILCIDGYHAETVGHCKQICVKDRPQCTPKCKAGSYCAECRTLNGAAYVCLPNGAVC